MKYMIKAILGGAMLGALFFVAGHVLLFMILLGCIMGFFFRPRHRFYHRRHAMAWADKLRSMSDEEYLAFKNKANACRHPFHSPEKNTP